MMTTPTRRVCLYFGSFNPFHQGHLALARYAHRRLGFDEIWLVLSPLNPLKSQADQLPYAVRAELIEASIRGEEGLKLCNLEVDLPQPRYTIRSLRALRLLHPQVEFSMLIGADNLLILPSWHQYERLLRSTPLYVYPRPGYEVKELPSWCKGASVHYCADAPQADISSSLIRQAMAEGRDLREHLGEPTLWGRVAELLCSQSVDKP
ncbi:MAG: nicotinate (nicotinamide) nucleotide adenylyltransferase [Porphyromonadaceae bacterium]|nr:nicotinate (nicotinamide) nucleotide adenylyltransferase [Porphyromonadaceae bacterium]